MSSQNSKKIYTSKPARTGKSKTTRLLGRILLVIIIVLIIGLIFSMMFTPIGGRPQQSWPDKNTHPHPVPAPLALGAGPQATPWAVHPTEAIDPVIVPPVPAPRPE